MTKERHTAAFVVGIVLGGAAGAAYGLLNAPRPGAATRASIEAVWNDLLELVAEGIAEVDNRVRALLPGDEPAWVTVQPPAPRGDGLAEAKPPADDAAAGGEIALDVVVEGPRSVDEGRGVEDGVPSGPRSRGEER